ncbi:MAG: polymer-forming cytoskeletal protein [Acidobacteria bacterium]|nr:polymer-forming cytoskeletal protein [Acidobacteriota bacterium]
MWNRKEKKKESPVSTPVYTPASVPVKPDSVKEVSPVSSTPQNTGSQSWSEAPKVAVASIGKSVIIRGDLSGSEDLFIDGQVEGTIELREHNLTVGPNGRVNAHVNAKEIVVQGAVKGNLRAADRVEIRKSGSVTGDLVAARIVIEDGAFFKGSIDIQKGGGDGKFGSGHKAESSSAPAQPQLASAGAKV